MFVYSFKIREEERTDRTLKVKEQRAKIVEFEI